MSCINRQLCVLCPSICCFSEDLKLSEKIGRKKVSNMNFSDTILLVEYCLGPNVATM